MPKMGSLKDRLQDALEKLSYRQWIMIAAGASILLGLAVFFALPSANEKSAREQAMHETRVKVVVAKQDIPQRTMVKESMLQVIEVPPDVLPAGAITDMVSVIDRPTSVPIQQGDILTDKKVLVDPRMAGFTGLIPENCRAMSVPITDVTGIAGFAKPGDYVDVMVITKGNGKVTGEILLQNIMLLAINKTGGDGAQAAPSSDNKDGKDSKDKDKKDDSKDKKDAGGDRATVQASGEAMATATLAVTPEDALKLAVASQNGTIYLVLRPFHPKDVFTINTDFFLLTESGQKEADRQAAAPAASAPATSPAQNFANHVSSAATPSASAPAAAPAPTAANIGNGIEVFRGTKSTRE
ncbi:Flp pilus assembly protein CpaB [Selenomonas sp.]|uniref:Flp pilus assembly protein CpaB n=1 Tax=Selenomonas sp. TaxID=2053611 RepID=UPI0025FA3FCD|nr:Flp pilus assembly protein CpaB [Selenomonas sp.]MCI6283555.1 Flp pilus assembly protein CpaB [Selenomonas sp.]